MIGIFQTHGCLCYLRYFIYAVLFVIATFCQKFWIKSTVYVKYIFLQIFWRQAWLEYWTSVFRGLQCKKSACIYRNIPLPSASPLLFIRRFDSLSKFLPFGSFPLSVGFLWFYFWKLGNLIPGKIRRKKNRGETFRKLIRAFLLSTQEILISHEGICSKRNPSRI